MSTLFINLKEAKEKKALPAKLLLLANEDFNVLTWSDRSFVVTYREVNSNYGRLTLLAGNKTCSYKRLCEECALARKKDYKGIYDFVGLVNLFQTMYGGRIDVIEGGTTRYYEISYIIDEYNKRT